MIYYLVYVSAATYPFSDDVLADILTVSRDNNLNLGITGLLLYHEGSIIQLLEGDKDAVQQLYGSIKKDTRHHNVQVAAEGCTEKRSFNDWSMGFKIINSSEWGEYKGYVQLNSSLLYGLIKKKNMPVSSTIATFIRNTGH